MLIPQPCKPQRQMHCLVFRHYHAQIETMSWKIHNEINRPVDICPPWFIWTYLLPAQLELFCRAHLNLLKRFSHTRAHMWWWAAASFYNSVVTRSVVAKYLSTLFYWLINYAIFKSFRPHRFGHENITANPVLATFSFAQWLVVHVHKLLCNTSLCCIWLRCYAHRSANNPSPMMCYL